MLWRRGVTIEARKAAIEARTVDYAENGGSLDGTAHYIQFMADLAMDATVQLELYCSGGEDHND